MYAQLTLSNPCEPALQPIQVRALADIGAMYLVIPEHVAIQLRLETSDQRVITIADGSRRVCAYAGPVEVRFGGHCCYTGALIMGDEVRLGMITMTQRELAISSR